MRLCGSILCLSILGLVQCSDASECAPHHPVYEAVQEWEVWKATHSKRYDSMREELEKHIVWHSNRVLIEQHNRNTKLGFYSYQVKLNHLGDLTAKDYHDKYLSYKRTNWSQGIKAGYVKMYTPPEVVGMPDSIDWRTKTAVTDVKYQDGCGASYAFASTGTLEGAYALTYDTNAKDLSEQNLIDCSVPEGNNGCNGGNMYYSFMYIIFNDGIDTANAYRYKATQRTCNFTSKGVGATMSGIIAINSGSESHLQAAVTYAGPVAAAVDARSSGFRFYSSGIFDSSHCSTSINHAMLIIGYGISQNGKEYWILKNSWGTDWGEDGYIRMTRNQYNQCGIASDCSYPSL